MLDPALTGVHEFVPTLTGVQLFVPTEVAVQVFASKLTLDQSSPRILPTTVSVPVAETDAEPRNIAFPTTDIDPEAVMFATPEASNPPVADIDPVAEMFAAEVRSRIPPELMLAEAEINPSAVLTRL